MIKDEELLSIDRKYLNHRGRKAADLAQITKDYADSMDRVPATNEGIATVLGSTIDALSSLKGILSGQESDNDSESQRQWADLSDRQQESWETVSIHRTHDMGINEAIRAVLIDGKKIRRRGWFGKLLFRNPGDMTDGGFFPTIMALKMVLNWRDVAEIKTCDAGSQVNAEDKKAHDWEIVDCTLPWEE